MNRLLGVRQQMIRSAQFLKFAQLIR